MTDLRKAAEEAAKVLANALSIDFNDKRDWYSYKHDVEYAANILCQALAQPEHRFDTPESHIVKWSIPVDPNNFGEPITFMGQYVGEGKVVSASFGLPKGAFEFAPPTGKGEASKIKHSLEPQPEQEPDAVKVISQHTDTQLNS